MNALEVKTVKKRIAEMKTIGNQMSNVFFNWSQQERFTLEERKMMKDLQTRWDALKGKTS